MIKEDRIYLDHNATTRIHPDVLAAMTLAMDGGYGNPSSIHWFGQEALRAVDYARELVAELIGADPEEIVFMGSGTEADNLAILGVVDRHAGRSGHIVTSAVEHQAVLNPCRYLERRGVRVSYLPVDKYGLLDPDAVAEAICSDTVLVSMMLANNDVGTIQPIAEIASVAKDRQVLFHTDAIQAVGRIPVRIDELGVDLLSFSGHKFYGPKGVGALYVRKGVELTPLVHGGHHERKRRAGTENVPGIAGFGSACRLAQLEMESNAARVSVLRDRLQDGIKANIANVRINGHPIQRLPNTLNVSIDGVDGESLIMNLDLFGIAASTGSACSSESSEPSHVLTAMGLDREAALGSVRFSLGRSNTEEEIDRTVTVLAEIVESLRQPMRQISTT
jgi:cysteine desulfurase